jgi:TnpA family transposase
VSDTDIALFTRFIPCGVSEAIYVLDGLLANTSEIQPDTVHTDTQGQLTPVFALAYLLGIKLMPRIRNWKHLRLYRPDRTTSPVEQCRHVSCRDQTTETIDDRSDRSRIRNG